MISTPVVRKCVKVGCSGQKYFDLNLLIFLFKLLEILSTEKGLYVSLITLKLALSIDHLSVSFILL